MIVMLFMFSACSKKKNPMTDAITNRDSVPVMVTRDVSTYISDSGVVRYKIIADEWKVFDRLDPSRWTFEEGVYLEKYDNKLNIEATITADTAYYFDKQELWELRGNVHIENEQDEQFDTQLLFWNQKTKQVYSDLYIRIRQQKRIITGIGFTSNQDFTNYTIKQTQGIFPIKEEATVATDSTTVAVDDSKRTPSKERPVTDESKKATKKDERSTIVEKKPEKATKETTIEEPSATDDVPHGFNQRRLKHTDGKITILKEQLKLHPDSASTLNPQSKL